MELETNGMLRQGFETVDIDCQRISPPSQLGDCCTLTVEYPAPSGWANQKSYSSDHLQTDEG